VATGTTSRTVTVNIRSVDTNTFFKYVEGVGGAYEEVPFKASGRRDFSFRYHALRRDVQDCASTFEKDTYGTTQICTVVDADQTLRSPYMRLPPYGDFELYFPSTMSWPEGTPKPAKATIKLTITAADCADGVGDFTQHITFSPERDFLNNRDGTLDPSVASYGRVCGGQDFPKPQISPAQESPGTGSASNKETSASPAAAVGGTLAAVAALAAAAAAVLVKKRRASRAADAPSAPSAPQDAAEATLTSI